MKTVDPVVRAKAHESLHQGALVYRMGGGSAYDWEALIEGTDVAELAGPKAVEAVIQLVWVRGDWHRR